jgi:hypothetical protein
LDPASASEPSSRRHGGSFRDFDGGGFAVGSDGGGGGGPTNFALQAASEALASLDGVATFDSNRAPVPPQPWRPERREVRESGREAAAERARREVPQDVGASPSHVQEMFSDDRLQQLLQEQLMEEQPMQEPRGPAAEFLGEEVRAFGCPGRGNTHRPGRCLVEDDSEDEELEMRAKQEIEEDGGFFASSDGGARVEEEAIGFFNQEEAMDFSNFPAFVGPEHPFGMAAQAKAQTQAAGLMARPPTFGDPAGSSSSGRPARSPSFGLQPGEIEFPMPPKASKKSRASSGKAAEAVEKKRRERRDFLVDCVLNNGNPPSQGPSRSGTPSRGLRSAHSYRGGGTPVLAAAGLYHQRPVSGKSMPCHDAGSATPRTASKPGTPRTPVGKGAPLPYKEHMSLGAPGKGRVTAAAADLDVPCRLAAHCPPALPAIGRGQVSKGSGPLSARSWRGKSSIGLYA